MIPLLLVFLPMLAAAAAYPLGQREGRGINALLCAASGLELLLALSLLFIPAAAEAPGICGTGLHLTGGSLRSVMCVLAGFMWLMTALASPEYFAGARCNARYFAFYFWTLGALMGVFLAADLLTLLIFFEIMSFTSYVWVVQNETPEAIRASETYLFIAVVGGLTMLTGLFLLYNACGTLELSALPEAAAGLSVPLRFTVGVCLLVGFGAKAGMFPLHIWLPKAHPVAPAPASALLSGILTKSGVFGVIAVTCSLFSGAEAADWGRLLLVPAVITMFLGAFLAVFSVDLKRTLACSSMSQIGFILTGVSMGALLGGHGAIAGCGTVLHMLNHSLIKLTLFVAAGVVYFNVHSLDLNDVRGFGRDKPMLKLAFLSGACSIAGIPGFGGYISKTLLHESIVEYAEHLAEHGGNALPYHIVEWIFLLSGGLTLAYMTRLFYILFIAPKPEHQHQKHGAYMSPGTASVLVVGGLLMPLLGSTAHLTMDRIAAYALPFMRMHPMEHAVHYFSLTNLKGAAISITIGTLVFLLVGMKALTVRKNGAERYRSVWPKKLDLEDLVYRPLLRLLSRVGHFFARLIELPGDRLVNGPGMKWVLGLGRGLARLIELPGRWLVNGQGLRRVVGLGNALARLIELPGEFLVNGRGLRGMIDLGTALARAAETLGSMLLFTPLNLIFFRAERSFAAPEDDEFSRYTTRSERGRVDRSFAADLLCAGLGAAAVLLFVTLAH
ncbi:MAG: complex I subunit 5 family protein [Oscillospiraceae bacterium]|nr:complex I subunit 5 family protein [Oscillospiraceae bacterium]